MPELYYWTVEDGKLRQVRSGENIHELNFPIDLGRHPTEAVDRFAALAIEMGAPVVKSLNRDTPTRDPTPAPKNKEPKKEAKRKVTKDSAVKAEDPRTVRYTEETGFEVDDSLRSYIAVRYVPKNVVDFVYERARALGGTFTKRDIKTTPGWTGGSGHLEHAIYAWRAKGVVDMMDARAGTYALTWDENKFKQFLKRNGTATPEDVRKHFWVPLDVARSKLEQAAQRDIVEKHARKDEYTFNSTPISEAKPQATPPAATTPLRSSGASVAMQAPTYDPSEYKFVKGVRILCDSCTHHYTHAYWHISKQHKVCGGCYQKMGGTTNHGKTATIWKPRKR